MEKNPSNLTQGYVIEYSIILIIVLYLIACVIVPFIPVKHHNFTIIFTVSGGIPAIALLFKEKIRNNKKG